MAAREIVALLVRVQIPLASLSIFVYSLFLIVAPLSLSGCAVLKSESISTLIEAGQDEKAKAEAMEAEEAAFKNIQMAIQNHQLAEGIPAQNLAAKYGNPVIVDSEAKGQVWTYKPQNSSWFGGTKIRLRFDESSRLVGWDCRAVDCNSKAPLPS